nr:transposase [Escherichia coli]
MIDVLGPEKRRRRTTQEKIAIVQQSFEPGMTVSLVARQHGVAASQLFLWRKQYQEGSLTAVAAGEQVINAKRVYRIMRQNALLLERKPAVPPSKRAHTGRVAVKESNQRWCSDGFEFCCDNGERLRVTFALDCSDREALHWAVTTGGFNSETVQDVMPGAVERRFGNDLPSHCTGRSLPAASTVKQYRTSCWERWNAASATIFRRLQRACNGLSDNRCLEI